MRYKESIAKTNKLYCSTCYSKIRKGDDVVFELDTEKCKMNNVYCKECGEEFSMETPYHDEHIFSDDAFNY